MFFVIPKEEKKEDDFVLATSDNEKLFIVNKSRQSAGSGYAVPGYFFFGTMWKWKTANLLKLLLLPDKRKKLLSLLKERGFFVKLKEGSFKFLSDYLTAEIRKKKKKQERVDGKLVKLRRS